MKQTTLAKMEAKRNSVTVNPTLDDLQEATDYILQMAVFANGKIIEKSTLGETKIVKAPDGQELEVPAVSVDELSKATNSIIQIGKLVHTRKTADVQRDFEVVDDMD